MRIGAENHEASSRAAFVRASLRHMALDHADRLLDQPSLPATWQDHPPERLSDLGAMAYLASFSPFHAAKGFGHVVHSLEPPLRLGQYRIFRSDDQPRAFVTWAGIDRDAEWQLAVKGAPLTRDQWNNGTSLWVIDMAAPFGHLSQVFEALAKNRQTNRVRALWHHKSGRKFRILEWSRDHPDGEINVCSYTPNTFATKLAKEG